MRKGLLSAVLLAFSFVYFAAVALPASAETLHWRFESKHPNIVDVELYSDTRRGHVWPGNKKIYVLDDFSTKTINISCQRGEKVCYGAWVRNRNNLYWGVGYKNRNRCSNCCYTCNGGQTKVIVLNP
ncbi:hypothetical protein [Roseibium aggregatum]|uniref:hypothetical protein n=1 Tax=Roseibium aggregatum TaxID=187304 RepID=UPI0025AC5F96|nr:hypothetical protein [Roseibium aggregatum]WJS02304.1 hypothetical protein QUB73_24540 [Roseibium aggregatum]